MKRTAYQKSSLPEPSDFVAKLSKFETSKWKQEDVNNWLVNEGFDSFVPSFAADNIDGNKLMSMTREQIMKIDDFAIGEEDKQLLWDALKGLNRGSFDSSQHPDLTYCSSRKVFQDAIHGSVELHPLLVKIIDTPQFQRLRNLLQLGCCSFVYPSANHRRFEHSIGVCHLAGQLLRKLKMNQPELDISERDILCVEIAGLCHDLGHGPYSHMFDGRFLPTARPTKKWRHEDSSVIMFDHLLKSNESVQKAFEKYDLNNETDISFIKEQIQGLPDGLTYKSRPRHKSFLYEVVANKKNGIDVDKWDYFARDCHYLGIRNGFDHWRLMNFVRVLEVNGEFQICTRCKEAETLYDMFHTRRALHKRAYQHRVCIAVEIMLNDAFLLADKHLEFYNSKGEKRSLSESIDDPETYTTLTDHVYYKILYSHSTELQAAREIIQRIERRELYKCVGETRPRPGSVLLKSDLPNMAKDIAESLTTDELEGSTPLSPNDIVLNIVKLDYGMGQRNPMESVWFYMKGNPAQAIRQQKEEISAMLPDTFSEQILVAYCKKNDPESMEVAEKCFRAYCENTNMVRPKDSSHARIANFFESRYVEYDSELMTG